MSIEPTVSGVSARIFMFDRHAETMPREAISALQTSRLKQTLECAYANVAHYRMKFDAAGVRPHDFKSLADLTKFPFTLKTDLRDNYPFGMFAVPRENLLRLHASSGTTGKPTVVGYTKGDLDLWSDLMARSLACAGVHRPAMAKKVSSHIKSLIGVTCDVVIKSAGEVPRSQGKAVRVRDERKS